MERRVLGWALALGCLLAPAALWADPPFETGDPEPTDPGHFEIYLSSSLEADNSGTEGELPELELDYGALPDLELHVSGPFLYDSPRAGNGAYGYGDTEWGAKFRLVHDWNNNFQIGTYPLVELPTGDRTQGLGNGQVKAFIPLWIEKELGPWTTYGGGGYWINPGAGNRNWAYFGWAIEDQLDPLLTLGGELFFHTSPVTGGANVVGWNGGGILNLDSNNHLMLSLGRDFAQGNINFRGYAAYEWTF